MSSEAPANPIKTPAHPRLPLFAYGSLKPTELAFGLISPFVSRHEDATVDGVIRLRDGLPLLDPSTPGHVCGSLIFFDESAADRAWQVVAKFEPSEQYEWNIASAFTEDGQEVPANILIGKELRRGTSGDPVARWSSAQDPVLHEGLIEVRQLVLEAAPTGVQAQPDSAGFWHQFFRLQASYLLLWSVVERYTALRYGPGRGPMSRIERLGKDPAFRDALKKVGARPGKVIDSRDPSEEIWLRPTGTDGAKYYYAIRSNLSHRGKGAFRDGRLVLKAVVELHDVMLELLASHGSITAADWSELQLRRLVPN
ncbi:hypothetical protein ACIQAR_30280 [Micromonospora chalcea]